MQDNLDAQLDRWRMRAAGDALVDLEPRVWSRIEAARQPTLRDMIGFRAVLAAGMLVIGIAAGDLVASPAQIDPSPFDVHSVYAPSTLLEGGQ